MARPTPLRFAGTTPATQVVSGKAPNAVTASAQVFRNGRVARPGTDDRTQIAQRWQIEAYRHVNICGEARYAATLFSSMAGRAEIGVSEPNSLVRKAVWVEDGPEVEAFAELAPTVRERSKLIRDYMLHYIIAGECYLISRNRVATDPPGADTIWEIVAVTELRRMGENWQIRHDDANNWLNLTPDDPVIRMWNPDPENRREAWSPYRAMLSTLREIEWLTRHIFTQVQSRLMSAGVWFVPDNITFPAPPPDAVPGGAEAIAAMNDAERFMVSLANASMEMLDGDEVSFPTVVMSDSLALAQIDQSKLIQFWSEIDDKAMVLRSDAVRRFALGMDLPPEQVLGSSGLAVTGAGGSAGSVNHWGVWANEEQTISAHIEPALDTLVGTLTSAFLRSAVDGTDKVIAYDTATLRLRQDRSKEAIELFDRGVLKAEVMVREVGFDPASDMMDESEHKRWLLNRIAGGSATPEQVYAALALMGIDLPVPAVSGNTPDSGAAPGTPGRNMPRSLDEHPYEGPPRVQKDQTEAPFSAFSGACEALVLRALEKAGARLLNDGKRGKDRDRSTPLHMAHIAFGAQTAPEFDFTLLPVVLSDLPAAQQARIGVSLHRYCTDLYNTGTAHTREALMTVLKEA